MITLLSTAGLQTPGLTLEPLGERRLLLTAGPLGAPRKGYRKGEGLKTYGEEVMRRTGLVASCFSSCRIPKDTSPTANPSNKTMEEAKERNTIQR